jgi:hypothetical protein
VEPEGETDMLKTVKESVHRMTSHLQLISGYLEMEDYTNALVKTRETIKELRALAKSLTGLANLGMTVPKDGAVVVPHGSTVVSYEDVTVTSTVMKCGQLTRVKYFPVTGAIIRRRSEDLIATN